jgi:hypothetical protein
LRRHLATRCLRAWCALLSITYDIRRRLHNDHTSSAHQALARAIVGSPAYRPLLAVPGWMMAAMTTSGNNTAYTADMDPSATPGQTAEVQRLFDGIGLDVRVSATYTTKSTAGDVVEAVLWLGGAGVAKAYLRAAGTFGDDLGHYAAKRVTG